MHARAAGRGEEDERTIFGNRLFAGAGDTLAGACAEGAAHERKVHDAEHHGVAVDLRSSNHDRLGLARLRYRRLDLRLVGAGSVVEREVVGVGDCAEDLGEGPLVSDLRDALAC